jgi:hypothetical protein
VVPNLSPLVGASWKILIKPKRVRLRAIIQGKYVDFSATFLLGWFLAELISSTLKMEAIYSCEASVDTQQTTQRYIPEDDILHNHRCENLKSYNNGIVARIHVAPTKLPNSWGDGCSGTRICDKRLFSVVPMLWVGNAELVHLYFY